MFRHSLITHTEIQDIRSRI